MRSYKDFFRWYNNKEIVPTLEAKQKMIGFYHDKDIDKLKLGYILPNLANICLNIYNDAKFYPFTERDEDLLEKNREDVVGGPSIIFTQKAVVDETFIRKSTNLCKSIVGIDASQLYPYSMCQPMPTGLYTRWDFDSETSRLITRQNKTRSFESMIMSFFQRTRPECEIESFFTTGRPKKKDCFKVPSTALDSADCWILSSYLNAGSSVFRKTMKYMPKITEYVSKIFQNLYSTDAALLRIM